MSTRSQTQPFLPRWTQGGLELHLAVDEKLNHGTPICRENDLPTYTQAGVTATDQHQMRQAIKTDQELLADWQTANPNLHPILLTGNGNLLANPGFVAWQNGVLYHLGQEPVFQRQYAGLVACQEGTVNIEEVSFFEERGRAGVLYLDNRNGGLEDITERTRFVTTGQPLIRHGQAISLAHIAHLFYDMRHLVRPICVTIGNDVLFVPTHQLQHGLLRKALVQPVHIELQADLDGEVRLPLSMAGWLNADNGPTATRATAYLQKSGILKEGDEMTANRVIVKLERWAENRLREALKEAEVELVEHSHPLTEGQARRVNDHLEIFFPQAIYPHNIFVKYRNGDTGFIVYPGRSGWQGTTLSAAQDFMLSQDVTDALLLDNGGDVRLWYRGNYLVGSSEGRSPIRSILVLTGTDATQRKVTIS